jgi:mono/diheme cytochrome c family protein
MRRAALLACLAASSALAGACSSGAPASPGGPSGGAPEALQIGAELDVAPVSFDADATPLGLVQAVTELGDDTIVFGDRGMFVITGGKVAANDASVKGWRAAATIQSPDGATSWAVGVSAEGHVLRVRGRTSLEDVTSRFGLGADDVTSVVPLTGGRAVFGTATGLVLVQDGHSFRFDAGRLTSLAAARDRVAGLDTDRVVVVDVAAQNMLSLPLPGARAVAFDTAGRVLASTEHALFAEREGTLASIYTRDDVALHGLATAPSRVWLGLGDRLASIEGPVLRIGRAGVALAPDAKLAGSPTGDVWAISATGGLARAGVPVGADEATWKVSVLPVYAHVCSNCHAPGGSSGIDLSGYAAWSQRRALIRERVVVKKNMPPGNPLTGADLDAVDKWSASN